MQPFRKMCFVCKEYLWDKCHMVTFLRFLYKDFFFLLCSVLRHRWNGDILLPAEGYEHTTLPWCMLGVLLVNFGSRFHYHWVFICVDLWSRRVFFPSRLHDLWMSNMSWHFTSRLLDFYALGWCNEVFFLLMFQQRILSEKRLLLNPMNCFFLVMSNKSLNRFLFSWLQDWFSPPTSSASQTKDSSQTKSCLERRLTAGINWNVVQHLWKWIKVEIFTIVKTRLVMLTIATETSSVYS